jgi:hypothetical protein
MGKQHGALLADDVRRGPVPYFRHIVQRLMGNGALGAAAPLLWTGLQRTVGARVAREIPPFARETIRGLAEGAGLPHARVLEGCTMPDTLVWLVSQMARSTKPAPAVAHRLQLGLGCTSAVAWGAATKDGKLYHARNFDYHGVDCWPKTAAVIFHEPDEGQRYVSCAAAGVALGGITAMNEAGLTLTVHQHMFTDRARLGGVPIGVMGDEIMRRAKSLDDAQRILSAQRPIGCWTYVITDGKTREVLCWEENPERHVAIRSRPGEDTFGYANVYIDAQLGESEAAMYGSYWRHNMGRFRRVKARLAEGRGALDPSGMASILGDVGDPKCRVRDSMAMVLTVASVVFSPEDGVLWLGTGDAPTSHGAFVPFDLNAQDHAPARGTLTPKTPVDAKAAAAFEHWRRAYVAYGDRGDLADTRREVATACALAPDQPVYRAAAGMLAIEDADARAAATELDAAIALGHPDEERVASFHLWRARAADLSGDADTAKRSYRMALALRADAPVHAAARKGLRKPYDARRARAVHVDMALGDVMSP